MDKRKLNLKATGLAVFMALYAMVGMAQPVLTLKEAIQLGLAQNFDIRIARNDALLAKESNTYGMAGFLPNVAATANRNYQWNDINQRFSSGLSVERGGVPTNQFNAGLGVNWVLFDGGKMFVTKRKQDTIQSAAELRIQNQILNFADTVSAAYYQLVLGKLDTRITLQDIGRTEERLKISSEQFRIGSRAKSDQLQAQIDLNVLKNKLLSQQSQVEIRKGAFNQLLGRDPEIDFEVVDSVILSQNLIFSSVKEQVRKSNYQLRLGRKNLEAARLVIEETKTRGLPQLSLNTGYNFTQSNSKAGFALYNRSLGPFIGLGLTVPIFTGVSINRLVRLGNLDLQTKQLQLLSAESRMLAQLWRAIKNLEYFQQSIVSEEQNIRLAQENLDIMKARFSLAQSTTLELKDAEFQLSNAQSRLLQARFNAKIAENQVLRLGGELRVE